MNRSLTKYILDWIIIINNRSKACGKKVKVLVNSIYYVLVKYRQEKVIFLNDIQKTR